MEEERKIIARACEARVLGVWALHLYDEDSYTITHVPTGCHVGVRLSPGGAEKAWRALGEQLPTFGEDGAFGVAPDKVNLKTVRKVIEAALRDLEMKP